MSVCCWIDLNACLSGGGSLFAIHGDCEAYDTRTDRWHMVASMSTRRARVGVAAIGNKLYAVGGYADPKVSSFSENQLLFPFITPRDPCVLCTV